MFKIYHEFGRSPDRVTFKNPNFQSICVFAKTWKYSLIFKRFKRHIFVSIDKLGVIS